MNRELNHEELEEGLKKRKAVLGRVNELLGEPKESLEERLKFETLLAELSARFVNLPSDRIDSEIEGAQRRICQHLDLDRSTLWQVWEGDSEALLLTHIYRPPESQEAVKEV